jgi:MoxR-like ATPase
MLDAEVLASDEGTIARLNDSRTAAVRRSPLEHLGDILPAAQSEVSRAIVGQQRAVELILLALLSRSHVLLEGPPGTGKTLLAQAIARLLGAKYTRVQFTPDTMPDEILGFYRDRGTEKVFERGSIFTNVLLADEVNRTPPRTQAALLEAMQERSVTVRGETHRLDSPFFVMATQNPYEHEGVYPLPESQLDRFLFKVELEYCGPEDDLAMLELPRRGVSPDVIGDVVPLLGEQGVLLVQEAVDKVELPESVARVAVGVVRRTRELPGVTLGAGPRAMIHVVVAAKARAVLHGRSQATVEDVLNVARGALPHRVLTDDDSVAVVEQAVRETEQKYASA